MAWLTKFLMSRASGWLSIIFASAVVAGIVYIQELRISAARCTGQEDMRGQLQILTDRVVEQIDENEDAQIKALREMEDACLQQRAPDELIDGLRD